MMRTAIRRCNAVVRKIWLIPIVRPNFENYIIEWLKFALTPGPSMNGWDVSIQDKGRGFLPPHREVQRNRRYHFDGHSIEQRRLVFPALNRIENGSLKKGIGAADDSQ